MESTVGVAPDVLGGKDAEHFLAYLFGDLPCNDQDAYNQGFFIRSYEVNYPNNPASTDRHTALCEALGLVTPLSTGNDSPEVVFANEGGVIFRQVILIPDMPDSAYVTYQAVQLVRKEVN